MFIQSNVDPVLCWMISAGGWRGLRRAVARASTFVFAGEAAEVPVVKLIRVRPPPCATGCVIPCGFGQSSAAGGPGRRSPALFSPMLEHPGPKSPVNWPVDRIVSLKSRAQNNEQTKRTKVLITPPDGPVPKDGG